MHFMYDQTPSRPITLEEYEFLIEPDEVCSEVSGGRLIRAPRAGAYHTIVTTNIYDRLNAFVRRHGLGRVTMEGGYRLAEHPLTIRGPDVGFISREKLPTPVPRRGPWPFGPDLAIEVLSPAHTASDLQTKVLEYFDAGAAQVWVIDPLSEVATIYHSLKDIEIVRTPATIGGGELLPGFELELQSIFE